LIRGRNLKYYKSIYFPSFLRRGVLTVASGRGGKKTFETASTRLFKTVLLWAVLI